MSFNRIPAIPDKLRNKKNDAVAVHAGALQDHLVRSMGGLSLADPFQQRVPSFKPKNYRKEAKPTLDTRPKKPTLKKEQIEKEYVLDPKPPAPTLAQKLGLVNAPEPVLSETDWHSLKSKSNEREDSKQPCVICKEDWGSDQQVLLSCSHVFHRTCLQAFERFSGKKTCPMCRREQYQTRVIHEGAHAYRYKCATRIQAMWKGYIVKSWYKKLRKTVPPKDPTLRRKFYEEKFSEITDRLVRAVDYDVNVFLTDIDRSLEQSREVFRNVDNVLRIIPEDEWDEIQLRAVQRGDKECPICLTDLERKGIPVIKRGAEHCRPCSTSTDADNQETTPAKPQGTTSATKAKQTGIKPLFSSNNTPSTSSPQTPSKPTHPAGEQSETNANNHCGTTASETQEPASARAGSLLKQKALLSCSHVFHMTCLMTFEELAEGDRRFTCPVCRAQYQKKAIC